MLCLGSNGWTGNLPPARVINKDLKIYPNPTTGIVNIVGKTKVDIKLYNVLGILVLDIKQIDHLDLSEFSKGTYYINITYDNKLINNQIIKF